MINGAKVLVTGAAGFIGSHLVSCLVHNGAQVRALVHYNSRQDVGNLRFLDEETLASVEVVHGDVRDFGSVLQAAAGCSVIYHLAALIGIPYSYQAPRSYVDTVIGGTLNVLEAAKTLGTQRVLHVSTSEVYGDPVYTPMDECHPLITKSPYSACKAGADHLAQSYFHSFGTPVVTVRPFNTYGARQSPRAVIPTIIGQLLAGCLRIALGDITTKRDLTHVSDTCVGMLWASKEYRAIGEVFVLGSGVQYTIEDIALKLIAMINPEATIVSNPDRMRPEGSEVRSLLANATKAGEWLEWQGGAVDIDLGLEMTVDFMRKHPEFWGADEYQV